MLDGFTVLPDLAELLQFDDPSATMRFGEFPLERLMIDFDTVSAAIVPLPPAVWAGLAGLVLLVGLRRLGWLF